MYTVKIVAYDSKHGILKLVPESSDDIWLLSLVVKPGDLVRGRTFREVRFGERGSGRSSRIPMTLTIRVENVDFQPFSTRLRIHGIVVEGPEKFGVKGKHHTITVNVGQEITIIKEDGWPRQLLEKLERSKFRSKVVVVAVDYDEYAIGVVQEQGLRIVVEEALRLPGKDDPSRGEKLMQAVAAIAKKVLDIARREGIGSTIVVGPGFVKEYVVEKLRELGGLRVVVDTASMGGVAGVYEAIRRGVVRRVLRELDLADVIELVGEFEKLVVKEPERVAYGIEDVEYALEQGAVEKLVLLDELLHNPDPAMRERVDRMLKLADQTSSKVYLVGREHPAYLKIRGFGGVFAILRYPLFRNALSQQL